MSRDRKTTKKKNKTFADKVSVKKILRISGAVLLCCIAITAVIYFIPKSNGSFNFEATKGYFSANTFLKSICKEDYEKAFKKLYWYDDAADVKKGSAYSEEEAFKIWSSRIKNEKSDTFSNYVVDFEDLKVYKEDGVLKGTVVLEIRERGVSRYIAEEICFCNGKIYSLTEYSPELMNQWEYAVSGYMGTDDE